ncbi:hypothetical protein MUP77_08055 [Candidatus Bathyarchaeota archaeon]|nr:hypothetical protein [Candidatus Bathyarchaeota archaeon]
MEYAIETINLVKRYPTSAPPIRGMRGPLGSFGSGFGSGRGGPASFGGIIRIFRGVRARALFFPGASTISWFLPQTWVYHLCRLAMLTNPSLLDPSTLVEFLKGSIFAVLLLPIGYKSFRLGVDRSKREGTLGWY